jgi:hypothetical protein
MTVLAASEMDERLGQHDRVIYPVAVSDCCEVCNDKAYGPTALGFDGPGWVTAYYLCDKGHLWECSWSEAILNGDVVLA